MIRFSCTSTSSGLRAFFRSDVFPALAAFLIILVGWAFVILHFSQHRESLVKPSKGVPTETQGREY